MAHIGGARSPSSSTVRVAAIQWEPEHANPEANFATALSILDARGGESADLVVLPEMGLSGYLWPDADSIRPIAETCSAARTQERWRRAAAERNLWMVVGHPAVDVDSGELRNRCTLVSPERIAGHYDKTCLFYADVNWGTPGNQPPPIWQTPWGAISPLICADLDYPEPIESVARSGASLIVFPTAWVDEPAPSATWRLRVAEYGIPMVAADITGVQEGVVFGGGSCVLDPNGEVVASLDQETGMVAATIAVSANVQGQDSLVRPLRRATLKPASEIGNAGALRVGLWASFQGAPPEPLSPPAGEVPLLVLPPMPLTSRELESLLESLGEQERVVVGCAVNEDAELAELRCHIPGRGAIPVAVAQRNAVGGWETVSGSDDFATIRVGGIEVGILGAWSLDTHHALRALSLSGSAIALCTGPHSLPRPYAFSGTDAPFSGGLAEPDPYFAHPARFRSGDSSVWLAFASSDEKVPGGIFSPNHIRWPRHEALADTSGWTTLECFVGPDNPWGSDAVTKPMLQRRRKDLYPDSWTLSAGTSERTNT